MDDLKKHFQKQEAHMQVETPDEKAVWERIETHYQKQHRPKRARIIVLRFAAAASILLLIGLAMRLWLTGSSKPAEPQEITQKGKPVMKKPVPLQDSVGREKGLVIATREKETTHQPLPKMQPVKKAPPVTDDYTQLIHFQLERLRRTPVYAETPGFFTEFQQQLRQMDADEAALRKDMQTYGLNEALTEALITIYQQKLTLLKSLQREINKMNTASKKRETATKQQPYYLNL